MTKALRFLAPYLLPYLFAGGTWIGMIQGGLGTYSGLFLFFLLHPLLDNLLFPRARIPLQVVPSAVALLPLLLALPLTTALLVELMQGVSSLSNFELTGSILSTGTIMGVLGINVAHELVHRRDPWLRACGVYLLMLCNFAHWGLSHVFSHHKHVGTPADSATARKGEWLYHFWWRAYRGGLHEAWQIEQKRLKGATLLGWLRHRVGLYFALKVFLAVAIYFIFGERALIFWWGQSFVAILLLETVDYIEHYGLSRKWNSESGLYEAFKPFHAWDSYQAWTNGVLMKLGYHSHHHLKASLPYTDLAPTAGRELPYGYSLMALMALCPPLFLRVMNARLEADPK